MLMPFVLLSLMAQGTMVAAGPQPDSFMLVLCADHLPVRMVLDDDGNVVRADEYQSPHDLPVPKTPKPACDWSLHAQPVIGMQPTLGADMLFSQRPADLSLATAARVLRAEILAPSARGPPLI